MRFYFSYLIFYIVLYSTFTVNVIHIPFIFQSWIQILRHLVWLSQMTMNLDEVEWFRAVRSAPDNLNTAALIGNISSQFLLLLSLDSRWTY